MDTALGENLPAMLLIGDSTATGYCETRECKSSLRRALISSWQAHVAAKGGSRWAAIAQDVDASLQQFYSSGANRKLTGLGSEMELTGATCSRIVFVLGTSDAPKNTAREHAWGWGWGSPSITNVLEGVNHI